MLLYNMKQLFKWTVSRQLFWNIRNKNYLQFAEQNRCPVMFSPLNEIIIKGFIPECLQTRSYAKRAQGKISKGGKKSMHLSDEEISNVIDVFEYQTELQLVVEKMKKEYADHLSLRSPAGNIDSIIVKIEEEEFPLHELAQISKKNPNLIAINMSDFPEGLKPAIQAIIDSGSGLNPQQEGTMIYLTVPKLTREHRENLAKNAKALCVKAKDEARQVQNSYVKEAKGKTELSEDLIFSATNQIMAMAEKCNEELEKIMKSKQKELLSTS